MLRWVARVALVVILSMCIAGSAACVLVAPFTMTVTVAIRTPRPTRADLAATGGHCMASQTAGGRLDELGPAVKRRSPHSATLVSVAAPTASPPRRRSTEPSLSAR